MKEMTSTLPDSTPMDRARFSSGVAGYRIVRLAMELFLVMRMQELGFAVKNAGFVYMLYSIASISSGFLFLAFPSLSFGSRFRALTFFGVSVSSMVAGFVFTFWVKSFPMMAGFAIICGGGSAAWNINFQSLTNLSFPKEHLGSVAFLRQMFECVGFLLPSICLAIVVSIDAPSVSMISLSAGVLGVLALLFSFSSMDLVVRSASSVKPSELQANAMHMTLREAMKEFFTTSVLIYFLLNSILLAVSNILMGSMSIITEHYFGLDPTFLWIGAIGFSIGGIFLVAKRTRSKVEQNSKINLYVGSVQLGLLFLLCIALTPLAPPSSNKSAKAFLFFFCLVVGNIYTVTYASSLELWLLKLKDYAVNFVSRAGVINNLGAQAIIAVIFQIQTVLIDTVLVDNDEVTWAETGVFFSPFLLLLVLAWIITMQVPYPNDETFGWSIQPYSYWQKLLIRFINQLPGGSSLAGSLAFGGFQEWRCSLFMQHMEKSVVSGGPAVPSSATLSSTSLQEHLRAFDKLGSGDIWWRSKKTELCAVLLDNETSLKQRLELILKAQESIYITTWVFEESKAGNLIADALIQRVGDGLEVRVIVDAITLFYLYEKKKLIGTNEIKILQKLSTGGVSIRMLDTWYKEKEPAYVIGTHRKIMIVDRSYLLTGGRNINDSYYTTNNFHYCDADVLLQGEFDDTCVFYDKLWARARENNRVCPTPNRICDSALRASIFDLDLLGLSTIGNQGSSLLDIEDGSSFKPKPKLSNQNTSDEQVLFFQNSKRYTLFKFSVINLSNVTKPGGANASTQAENGSEWKRRSSIHLEGRDVALFQLDHKAGNSNGHDIVLGTLLFLIETAKESMDLTFGYLQLFAPLDEAITRAVNRGVKIRVVSNSSETNGLPTCNLVFKHAFARLLELGVEVYVPCRREALDGGHYCLHYKTAIADGKVAMIGSWNCTGTSVFFDADFSVVMFDESGLDNIFSPFQHVIVDAIDSGRLVRMESLPDGFEVPLMYKLLASRYGKIQIERGF